MKKKKKVIFGLILICLILFTSSCSRNLKNCTEQSFISPPYIYLEEIKMPELQGGKNKDLLNWALELKASLKLANSDKKALRVWALDMEKKIKD